MAKEILEVIISSFHPTRKPPALDLEIDHDILSAKPLVVDRLLTENPWEKAALAELYEKHVIKGGRAGGNAAWCSAGQDPRVIFIESGSTCACVSEQLRRLVLQSSDFQSFQLRTNNHLTAWLFLNQDLHVEPKAAKGAAPLVPYLFAGRLESKYHGIFPFYKSRGDEQQLQEEREGYAQLRLAIAPSDLLLLTASRLSLRYGPLVGSRENAIFKNACYNACVPMTDKKPTKEIHLFITIQKLVAHSRKNQSKCAALDGFHTWNEELKNIRDGICFSAFDFRDDSGGGKPQIQRVVQSPFSKDLVPNNRQRVWDGTYIVWMGEGSFRVCETWEHLFTKAKLTVKIFVAFQGELDDNNPNLQWIDTEVKDSESALQALGIRIHWRAVGSLPPRGPSEPFSLASIEIQPY